ncbi:MAG: Omp28-related outer membrane protein [Bacteroidetes bacterium]|nr:Omp28-related outer membrane protein [Bacteroidota bacterium]
MKIFRVLLPVLLVCGWILTSCDKLDPPYAAVKTQFDTTNKPFILLEEYTGHKCNNCPLATKKAHSLAEYYMGRVIIMEVHATNLADPDPKYTLDLRTTEGSQWCTDFGIGYVPRALVNRSLFGGSYPVNSDQWATAIQSQMLLPVKTSIRAQASYNADSKEITANITVLFKRKLSADAGINLYIVEDSIVGLQSNKDTAAGPTPEINPYYFNETFRASMNGTYGDQLTTTVDTAKTYTYTKKYTISSTDWVPAQLYLITTITDPATPRGEIIGVNKIRISSSAR